MWGKMGKIGKLVTEPLRRSIRNRLILTMILISVLPTLAVTLLAAENNRKTMEAEVVETNLSNMKWTGVYLSDQFAQLNNLIYTMLISPSMSAYVLPAEDGQEELDFSAQRTILDTLTSLFYSAGNHVVGVELYLKERKTLLTINAHQSDIDTVPLPPPTYAELFGQRKDVVIHSSPDDPSRFQLTRSINRFENREKIGGITLEVQWNVFDQTLELLGRGEEQAVFIADADGRIYYNPYEIQVSESAKNIIRQSGSGPAYARSADEIVFTNTIDPSGLKLVKVIPNRLVYQSAMETARYGFIVGIVSAAVSLFIAVFIAWRTANPIVRLARSLKGLHLIQEAERVPVRRYDEIGLLENRLQQMAMRIREHIRVEYSMSLERKTAELKALQARINPHFLQNTLQLIGSMLFSKQPSESYEVIRSLSDMFRYIIREPEDLADFMSEINHLNHYMLIQEKRYGTRLRFTLSVDEALRDCRIPKLTLQPIVENAFFHGLEPKQGVWNLAVSAFAREGKAVIRIQDNGVGIRLERLTELQKQLKGYKGEIWTHGERIGLNNVASRIGMHFGDEYGVEIESVTGEGTIVTVSIPLRTGGHNDAL
jgi:two-component system sensor histidine kinase YesM